MRMSGYGALIRVDGSDHDWFEGRATRCTLMVYIDDANSKIQKLMFFARADRPAYVLSTCVYLPKHDPPHVFQNHVKPRIYACLSRADNPFASPIQIRRTHIRHSITN